MFKRTVEGTRLCSSCFGQGVRPYTTSEKRIGGAVWIYDALWQEIDPMTFGASKPYKYAYVQFRLCRNCGGTGREGVKKPGLLKTLNELFVEILRGNYLHGCKEDIENKPGSEDDNLYNNKRHWKYAALAVEENLRLRRQVNALHRRAQRAEGEAIQWKTRYLKAVKTLKSIWEATKDRKDVYKSKDVRGW